MALFGKKKEEAVVAKEEKKDEVAAPTKADATPTVVVDSNEDLSRVVLQPRITEKATLDISKGVYVFNVAANATKPQIKAAIKAAYNVEPVKVRITQVAKKNVRSMRTGKKGVKQGGKKAYVYLKSGDKISLM